MNLEQHTGGSGEAAGGRQRIAVAVFHQYVVHRAAAAVGVEAHSELLGLPLGIERKSACGAGGDADHLHIISRVEPA